MQNRLAILEGLAGGELAISKAKHWVLMKQGKMSKWLKGFGVSPRYRLSIIRGTHCPENLLAAKQLVQNIFERVERLS
ncbi:hypothetical protein EDB37_1010114 [Vibrio crassostreae]|nr:hypothetical protein EDB37_1010114 [Vibrio crassostreae]